ncbi:hypothetical protein HK100_008400 [Physocladia obscura]|uniref:DNA-3-methyladenine glycosylase I n=1 Tax=Physocladia obscura TaxID=109957 RepID=A0AAD5SNB8_9FUNG|nr:hypothetical protein HK100_008400 [Physocladia obscura]
MKVQDLKPTSLLIRRTSQRLEARKSAKSATIRATTTTTITKSINKAAIAKKINTATKVINKPKPQTNAASPSSSSPSSLPPRCLWCTSDSEYINYHDTEWGRAIRTDSRLLFEFLCLEGAQAGLNWLTILKKRDAYKRAFSDFDVAAVAKYTDADAVRILGGGEGIVRNKLKVASVVQNAKAVLEIEKEGRSFADYLWSFAPTVKRHRVVGDAAVALTEESEAMSRDMKKRGFKFVGATICYAFMQAVGIVDDHDAGCFLNVNSRDYGKWQIVDGEWRKEKEL